MSDSLEALGEVGAGVLRRLAWEILAREEGAHLLEPVPETLRLRLELAFRGSAERAGRALVEALRESLREAIRRATAFRPGRTFCHRCGSPSCEHAAPPSARHVFAGYGPTGRPVWEDFAQLLLEKKHPGVDRLYAEPPGLVTLVQGARELHARLLGAFREPRYRLRGQLSAGFFADGRGPEGRRELRALCVQVVATGQGRRASLALNVLGADALAWAAGGEPPWRPALRWGQRALAAPGPGAGQPERVWRILQGMARRLEREARARGRRTRHAQWRHESGARPTRMALEDVRTARHEAFFVDERTGTRVVVGERGRTHFFTAEGRLVSSVRYGREAIERKRVRGVWRPATAGEVSALRDRLGSGAYNPASTAAPPAREEER